MTAPLRHGIYHAVGRHRGTTGSDTMALNATSAQPSFYYFLIAKTCFHRSRLTSDRARSHALSESGRHYLVKAEREIPSRDSRPGS